MSFNFQLQEQVTLITILFIVNRLIIIIYNLVKFTEKRFPVSEKLIIDCNLHSAVFRFVALFSHPPILICAARIQLFFVYPEQQTGSSSNWYVSTRNSFTYACQPGSECRNLTGAAAASSATNSCQINVLCSDKLSQSRQYGCSLHFSCTL